MAQDLFRVEVGIADDNIHYLSGSGAPAGTRADDAPVGSKWSDTANGDTYTKTGASTWTKLAVGGDTASLQTQVNNLQTEVDAIETGVGLNSDGTYTAPVGSNYLGAAATATVKAGLVALDTATKAASDAAATVASDLATFQTAQDTRDDGQDTAIAGKVSKTGDTMTGNLAFGGTHTVTGLAAPVDPSDAATKNYVDNKVVGLSWQEPVGGIGASNPGTASTGDRFLNTTTGKIHTATAHNTWDAGVTPADGWAVFDRSTDTGYNFNGTTWVQFTGGGAISAGVGLSMTGNQLDINLGAGIAQLPSDEVGIDVHSDGGLMLTTDNASDSTDTAAKLAVRLEGTTLVKGAGGIKLSPTWQQAITDNTAAIAQEAIDRAAADAGLDTRLDTVDAALESHSIELGYAFAGQSETNVTTITDLMSFKADYACITKYLVHARTVSGNKVQVVEILATHNNVPGGADATQVDFTVYGKLKIGGNISGLQFTVALTGAGTNQQVVLRGQSTEAVNIAVQAEHVPYDTWGAEV